jgi:hypothetical protein
MKYHQLSVAIIAIFLLTTTVQAHGTGASYEETKDGYKIDIGYDESIVANKSMRFDFVISPEDTLDIEGGEVFSDVWVTLTQDDKIFFAGGIDKPEFGATGFTYIFPDAGSYTVSARFQKGGETVVKTEFPLTVNPELEPKSDRSTIMYRAVSLGTLIIGLVVGFLLGRRKKS